jgi:hypothetical protein
MIQEPMIVDPTKAANILTAETARSRGVFSDSVPMAAEVKPEKMNRATRCDSMKPRSYFFRPAAMSKASRATRMFRSPATAVKVLPYS